MTSSGAYGAAAREVCALFADYLDGDAGRPALVVHTLPCSETARDALQKTFSSFGYEGEACTFVSVTPLNAPEQDVVELDPQAMFLLVEGIDPLNIVATDERAAKLLEQTYRQTYALDSAVRIFGRPSAVFSDLNALLQTPEGKQCAWKALKPMQP